MRNRVKKLMALLLLGIILLNSGGEVLVHQYLVYRSDCFYNHQISRGLYNVHDLTEVKVPANMPGAASWGNYENMNGEVRFANTAYNYVKIKITRTAIYLLCIPNYATTRLCGQNIIHAENMNDIPVLPKQHVPYGKMNTLGHFNFVFTRFEFAIPVVSASITLAEHVDTQFNCHLDIPQPPPKASFFS
jgi:hypothetical protein